MCIVATFRTSTKDPVPMYGGTSSVAPEKMSQTGRRVSFNFDPEEGRTIGGPITTEGLIVEMENTGCMIVRARCLFELKQRGSYLVLISELPYSSIGSCFARTI